MSDLRGTDFTLESPTLFYYRGRVVRVIDGDSVELILDLGFRQYQIDRFRVKGVDTPELRSRNATERKKAQLAKEYVEQLTLGKEVLVRTFKADKYGRWLADILYPVENDKLASLAQTLIDEKIGRVYTGGKRKPWDFLEGEQ